MASSRPIPPVAERTRHPYLTHDMILQIPDALQKTSEKTAEWVESTAKRLKSVSHLYFTGCGTAFFSAMLGSNILSLSDPEAFSFEPVPALELATYRQVASKSATFGVSHSGITKTTVDALHKAKSRGSYTVGITHFAETPISRVADETIVVGNGPDKSRCHTKCYLTGALPLTTLGASILQLRGGIGAERLSKIQTDLKRLPQLSQKVLSATEKPMKELAEASGENATVYFAGSQGSYSNSIEAALKLMETSYIPSQGFETEQLLHGPWASIDSNSIIFVMATESGSHARSVDLVKAADHLGSTVVPLVFEGDGDMAALCKTVIELLPVDEQLAPYLSIIPLYFFAYYSSLRRGYDPDYLRYLTPAYWDARTIIFPPGTH